MYIIFEDNASGKIIGGSWHYNPTYSSKSSCSSLSEKNCNWAFCSELRLHLTSQENLVKHMHPPMPQKMAAIQ
jgi:hypothetical protein